MIHLILLSGGSGTRLWPLSNETRSKQFLKVLRDSAGNHESMVQRVFNQIQKVPAGLDLTIATASSQALSIEQQLPDGSYQLVLEPERRDTMPAIMLACAHLRFEQKVGLEDTVIVMPIDTFADQGYYDSILLLDRSVQNDVAQLTLLGVAPTYPSEKYGYIVPEPTSYAADSDAYPVSRFVEKPSEDQAIGLIEHGALWNCGVFAFKLGDMLAIVESAMPGANYSDLCADYGSLPKISFDYGVVEKAQSIAVIRYEGPWKDLGTWNTLTEEMAEKSSGHVVIDQDTCSGTYVVNETGLPMVVAGIEDAVVVATYDGILVSSKEKSAQIKQLVESVKESRPMYEKRSWGEYRVLDMNVYPDGRKALTKELVLNAGEQLSYQRHRSRSEVWTIVSGSGQVVLDGLTKEVEPGSVVEVGVGVSHSIRADKEMHIIEVQLGALLEESDIERLGIYWEDEK